MGLKVRWKLGPGFHFGAQSSQSQGAGTGGRVKKVNESSGPATASWWSFSSWMAWSRNTVTWLCCSCLESSNEFLQYHEPNVLLCVVLLYQPKEGGGGWKILLLLHIELCVANVRALQWHRIIGVANLVSGWSTESVREATERQAVMSHGTHSSSGHSTDMPHAWKLSKGLKLAGRCHLHKCHVLDSWSWMVGAVMWWATAVSRMTISPASEE